MCAPLIEAFMRPQIISNNLGIAYEQMARDEAREQEAIEWAEATMGDVAQCK